MNKPEHDISDHRSVLRKEDLRFITGRGRYTDDIARPGDLHAVFVRSPHAHADIGSIDLVEARAMPGVVAIFTGEDILADNIGAMGHMAYLKDKHGRDMVTPPRRPLSAGRVRYTGEPVALVIADSIAEAKDAAERVAVTYEELACVTDIGAALEPGAPCLWPEAPGNLCCEIEFGDTAAVARGFAAADRIIVADFVNQRVVSNPMEPRSALGEFDVATGHYVLHASLQNPHNFREMLVETLGIPEHRIRVISPDVGGGFGTKGAGYPEEMAILWAAGKLGRGVKWRCERSESFLSDAHGRDQVSRAELAVDKDGRFIALKVAVQGNLGAYASSFGPGVPVFCQILLSGGPYAIPNICGNIRIGFTNTVPTDAYRGAGRPETAYTLERIVERAAIELGIDPAELRRRNLIEPAAMPYKIASGLTYDSGDFPGLMQRALDKADYDGIAERKVEAKKRGKLRGIGIAIYVEHAGWGPSRNFMSRGSRFPTYEMAELRFLPDGGAVIITGTHTHGQGLETALAQLVAAEFSIPMEDIQVLHGDTSMIGYGRGTVGSRSLLTGGGALRLAMDKVITKGKRIAAQLLEVSEQDMQWRSPNFFVAGTDREVAFRDVVRAAYYPVKMPIGLIEAGLAEIASFEPAAMSFPNGCHVCELDIDRDTGLVEIVHFTAVDDFGHIVNPMLVDGQLHGGIAQGVGQALLERSVYEESGQLVSGSFMDYAMPRAYNLGNFDLDFKNTPCRTNILGVKGCGEAGVVGAPPAVMNALIDALTEFGVKDLDMPATPSKLWSIIHER